jgi:hypothetical protein
MIVNPNQSVHTGLGIVTNRTLFADEAKSVLLQQSNKFVKSHRPLRRGQQFNRCDLPKTPETLAKIFRTLLDSAGFGQGLERRDRDGGILYS